MLTDQTFYYFVCQKHHRGAGPKNLGAPVSPEPITFKADPTPLVVEVGKVPSKSIYCLD